MERERERADGEKMEREKWRVEGKERESVCIFVACSCVPLVQTAELCVSAGPINFYVVCDRSTAK